MTKKIVTSPSLATPYNAILLTATLLTGTAAALAAKTLYQIPASGESSCDTEEGRHFDKPYFETFAMFIGEALCLPFYYFFLLPRQANALQTNEVALLGDDVLNSADAQLTKKPPAPKWFFLVLCSFDLTASTLSFVGLQWVSASINSMFRGSLVIFVALFSIALLRRRLASGQWAGLAIVFAGLVVVGLSSGFDASGSSAAQQTIGAGMIILSSALNGLQNTVEEKLSKMLVQYEDPHPMIIVGYEGVFGCMLSTVMLGVVWLIPGDDCGAVENSYDTLLMLSNSPVACVLVIIFILSLGAMNGLSMEVGRVLSAVYRNLVQAVRTISIWIGGIFISYIISSDLGERLAFPGSLIQLGGFTLLVTGSVLYSRSKEITIDEVGLDDDELDMDTESVLPSA